MTNGDLFTRLDVAGQSWRDRIKVHPAADEFPMLEGDDLVALGEDIKANGLRQPIVFCTDSARPDLNVKPYIGGPFDQVHKAKKALQLQLIDGRNRFAAMQTVGILDERLDAVITNAKILWGDDISPEEFVISANVRRRHLTADKKRELIAKLLKLKPERSDRETAKIANVSDKTVGALRAELEQRAEVPHVDKRTDSKGRSQPSHKASPTRSETSASQPRHSAIAAFGVTLHQQLAKTPDDLTRMLRDERARIAETIPLPKRVALARAYLDALGIELVELRQISLGEDAA
jgi:hypothetical protein